MSKLTAEHKEKLLPLLKNRPNQNPEEALEDIELSIIPAVDSLIEICGGDPDGDGQYETSFRVVKAWLEMTEGYQEDPTTHLQKQFDLEEEDTSTAQSVIRDEFIVVKNITLKSVCEHHIAPFIGKAHIAYIPGEKVVGLSKLARLVRGYAKRMQIQEKITVQIAEAVMEKMGAKGVAVMLEATHTCMVCRGVEESTDSSTITISTRGLFRENQGLEDRFLAVVK